MRDLAKSMLRFSWATGLLGAAQVGTLLRPGSSAPDRLGGHARRSADRRRGLDAVTWATQNQLGEMMQAAFHAGDDLSGEWLELLTETLLPWRWPRAVSELAGRSLDTLQIASPLPSGSAARQELKNKYEVYWLVKGVRERVGLPPVGVPFELERFVRRAYRLDTYSALWVVEGIGHDFAETALASSDSPRGLLRGAAVDGLPANSLPMLHGGLGLAFAEHVLGGLNPESTAGEAAEALERFVDLCRSNSTKRYADSALESLGLDTRCFFPALVPAIERGLLEMGDAELRRFFWHGVGRALYFLPVNFIPGYGTLWHAVVMAERESPDATAHENALAGVSYAFTMVNMSHPEILASVLHAYGEELRGTAFADGVVAAVVMRQEITPGASVLSAFVDHRPDDRAAAVWDDVVRRPCRRALALAGSGGDWQDRQVTDVYRSLPRTEAVAGR